MLTFSTNWQLYTALNNEKKKSASSSRNDTCVSEDGQTYELRKVYLHF